MDIHHSPFNLEIIDIIKEQLAFLPFPADDDEFPGTAFCLQNGPLQHAFQFPAVHRLQQVLESLRVIGFKHVFPAGGDKDKYLVRGFSAEKLCRFHAVHPPHDDIQEDNVEAFQRLQQLPAALELPDDAWRLHLFHDFPDPLCHVTAFQDFVIAHCYLQHLPHLFYRYIVYIGTDTDKVLPMP